MSWRGFGHGSPVRGRGGPLVGRHQASRAPPAPRPSPPH
ncbi:hypothetical protein STTU_4722 [Streptomyces sp. Tu6071]|nr:hypothetical protein STTU_4722 [Streptomyces sp. Tu6071]